MSDDQNSNPPPHPTHHQQTQPDRVESLSQEVAGLRGDMARLFSLLEAGNARATNNSQHNNAYAAPSNLNQKQFSQDAPPHLEVRVPPRMEPPRLQDVWFSGDLGQLLSFLRTIRDHLRPRVSYFESDTRRIIWISRHFGYGPQAQRKSSAPSPAENWYTSLITDNARRQGPFNPYGDLDGLPFCIPALLSVEAFLDAMIAVFGDRFMKENAKRALAACKQGQSTIGEYNSRFSSLVYLVEDVEEARVERYVLGLNPRIILQAMSREWRSADTLDARMNLATEAAAQLDLLSLLPTEPLFQQRQRPFSSAPPPGLSFPPPHQSLPQRDPNAMEINAASIRRSGGPPNLFDLSRSICRQKNLCFRCLKPTIPVTHTGSLDCPNPGVTREQREAFVQRHRPSSITSVLAIVSALPVSSSHPAPHIPSPLTYCPPIHSSEGESHHLVDVDVPVLGNVQLGHGQGYDEEYEDLDDTACAAVEIPIATVHVRLDCSKKGCLLVPATFKSSTGSWVSANVLVDTGAMANFISEEFVRRHDLPLRTRKFPVRCVGFDGREGVGGLVTQDWAGIIRLSSLDSKPIPLGSSFGVT
ncbi:hypothetical protein PCANC_14322 [Puccinia coronata f. sp. avenae]|uniref:Retrotransposon gag domain-containing protein n=1 Tax=Puccinia coronata f. sp. avenae TaxID=200324 RepID=A0A2N5VLE0_9BASI|nr:hypothetical protein PCANC_14322 [Puccinia coronata f. sp. avenae]